MMATWIITSAAVVFGLACIAALGMYAVAEQQKREADRHARQTRRQVMTDCAWHKARAEVKAATEREQFEAWFDDWTKDTPTWRWYYKAPAQPAGERVLLVRYVDKLGGWRQSAVDDPDFASKAVEYAWATIERIP